MNVHDRILDYIGKLVKAGDCFGMWTVLHWYRRGRVSYARCRCRCGALVTVRTGNLVSGQSTRCMKCKAKAMLGNKRSQLK